MSTLHLALEVLFLLLIGVRGLHLQPEQVISSVSNLPLHSEYTSLEWKDPNRPMWARWKPSPILRKKPAHAASQGTPTHPEEAAWNPVLMRHGAEERYRTMNCKHRLNLKLPRACVHDEINNTVLTDIPTYYVGSDASSNINALFPNFHFIQEVNGSDHAEVERLVTQSFEAFQTPLLRNRPGILGCTLAHLRAIEAAYMDNVEVALILERDALPNLAAWTKSNIQEFYKSLPLGWNLAQLQWTSGDPVRAQAYKMNDPNFTLGSGYGTVAYLLHRRGMENIMNKLRFSKNKFDLQVLHSTCAHLTADDCLLNLGPDASSCNHGEPFIKSETIYKANPPIFTSYDLPSTTGNEGKSFVIKSFCYDIFNAASFAAVNCAA